MYDKMVISSELYGCLSKARTSVLALITILTIIVKVNDSIKRRKTCLTFVAILVPFSSFTSNV